MTDAPIGIGIQGSYLSFQWIAVSQCLRAILIPSKSQDLVLNGFL